MNVDAAILAIVVLAAVGSPGQRAPDFAVGQVWDYTSRPGEASSTVTVLRIDRPEGQPAIVHVAIMGLHVKNPHAPTGFSSDIKHVPMSEVALRSSVTKLVRTNSQLPDYEAGYAQWKQARGGVFTVSVADAVDFVERAMNQ
jgi:hypothetical protein